MGVEEHQAGDIDTYHCPNCQPEHGPLTRMSPVTATWYSVYAYVASRLYVSIVCAHASIPWLATLYIVLRVDLFIYCTCVLHVQCSEEEEKLAQTRLFRDQ